MDNVTLTPMWINDYLSQLFRYTICFLASATMIYHSNTSNTVIPYSINMVDMCHDKLLFTYKIYITCFFFLLTNFNGGSAVYVTLGVGQGKGTQVIIPTLNGIFKR